MEILYYIITIGEVNTPTNEYNNKEDTKENNKLPTYKSVLTASKYRKRSTSKPRQDKPERKSPRST